MLFKYKGIDRSGNTKRGYVNAIGSKSAIAKVKEKDIVFIEYLGERVDNPYVNKVRKQVDSRVIVFEETFDKIKEKTIRKNVLKRDSKKGGSKKEKSDEDKNIASSIKSFINLRNNKKAMKTLKSMSVNDDLGAIINKLKKDILEKESDGFDDFNFQIEQELYKEQAKGSPTLAAKQNKSSISEKKGEKSIDWDLIEGEDVEKGKKTKLKVKSKEIILFTRKLRIMISSGVALIQALIILEKTSEKNLASILTNVIDDMQMGNSFSKSLSKYPKQFDHTYVSLVSIGETSGSLDNCLLDIIEIQEQRDGVNKKLKTAAIYPTIIGVVLLVLLTLASIFFMPTFKDMFSGAGMEMPWITNFVFKVSDYLPLIVGVTVGIIIGFILLRKSNKNFDRLIRRYTNKWMFKIPVIKHVVLAQYMLSFSSTISLMLKNGIRLEDTLALTSKTINNIYMKNEIANASALMLQGLSFSEALREQEHFDDILINIVLTGEEAGKLSYALGQIADYYKDDLNRKINNLMEMVQPVSMLLIGSIVGPVIVAIYLPILDMSSGALM